MAKSKKSAKNKQPALIAIPFVVLLLTGAYFLVINKNGDTSKDVLQSTVTKVTYKNGTYEEIVSYQVPKSTNKLKAKITIKDDIIKEISVNHEYSSQKSKEYTENFDKAISGTVVGKNINNSELNIVGGASLTTEAFKTLIQAIKDKS